MLLDEGGHCLLVGGEGADGGDFIFAHEAAVAFNISAEDRRELAFDPRWGCTCRMRFSIHDGLQIGEEKAKVK